MTGSLPQVQVQLGIRIRELRLQKEYSQEDLAEISGLDRTYVASVERGRRNATIGTIWKLAQALGLSLPEFFNTPHFHRL